MADFSQAQISQQGGSPVTPPRAVQEPSAATAALGAATQIGGSLFEAFVGGQEKKAQQAQASAVSAFSRNQLAIADAVDRGDLTSQEGRMRMRSNFSRAIADNPSLTEDLSDAHKSILSTAGLGKVAAEGTEEEQAAYAFQREARKNGFILPGMSGEEVEAATEDYRKFVRGKARMEEIAKRLAVEKSRQSLETGRITQQTARLGLQAAQRKNESQIALSEMNEAVTGDVSRKTNLIIQQVGNGTLTKEEGLRNLEEMQVFYNQQVSQIGQFAGSDMVSNMTRPLQDTIDLGKRVINGEISTEVATKEAEGAVAKATAMFADDPETVGYMAASKVLGENSFLVGQETFQNVNRVLKENGLAGQQPTEGGNATRRPPANLTGREDQKSTEDYLGALENSMTNSLNGSSSDPEASRQEVAAQLNGVLKGVGRYAQFVEEDNGTLQPLVNFFSGEKYGRYVEGGTTGINEENAERAGEAIQAYLIEQVQPLVREEWQEATQTTSVLPTSNILGTEGEEAATRSLIVPQMTPRGVRFVARDDTEMTPRMRAKISNLNERVGTTVNKLIRTRAHLEGHRDYAKIFDQDFGAIFGEKSE